MIKVTYDGEYPSTCMGTLTIEEDGKQLYKKQFCCYSTGSCWFDSDWNSHIEQGTLKWEEEEANKYPKYIQELVQDELDKCHVCCGGCL